jgi:dihydrofolate synthase/folylpolyglutamate synthase
MDIRTALADLDSRQPESMPEPSLDRIRAVAELLDHPQLTYPSIHITGTNGKTTTSRLITALSCSHGLTTGNFVSPHISTPLERLSVCGQEISEEEFGEEYERLLPYLDNVDRAVGAVTYFETLVALAYLWFADKPVGLGVFEVGMGGAWDATNLIAGDVAVLCPIGLDHVQYLGTTIAQIAAEKAGIIKNGKVAVVREQMPEAMRVIDDRARSVGADLVREDDRFGLEVRDRAAEGQVISARGLYASYPDLVLPVYGEHQARNAAASIAACEALLGRALDERAVRSAFATLTAPARIEVVARHPLVVLDGAHNVDAMEAVVATLREAFRWARLHAVTAIFDDKDVEGVMARVAEIADRAYVSTNASPRSAPPDRVAAALRAGVADVRVYPSVAAAVEAARAAADPADLILVTGSFYTVGDARPLFLGN